jgi:hypothetical protein
MATDSGSSSAAGLVAERVWNLVGEFRTDGGVLGERAVDGRRRIELHVRAEVVAAGAAFSAAAAVALGFDRDALTDPGLGNLRTDGDDGAGAFVAENQRTLDDELTNATVPVVMGVGAADADRGDLDQDLVTGYLGQRDLFHVEGFGAR